jgi:hypothetical protein
VNLVAKELLARKPSGTPGGFLAIETAIAGAGGDTLNAISYLE